MRIEDRAAVFLVQAHDLVEARLGGVADHRQAEAGDIAVEADEFEMADHLVADQGVDLLDALDLVRERVEHLEIGDRRIDAQRAQRGVVPGQFEVGRQALEVGLGRGVEDDLGAPAAGESEESVERLRGDRDEADTLAFAEEFLVALEIGKRGWRGDRRDQLGQQPVLQADGIAVARRVHETVESDDNVDPLVRSRQRHLHLGDDAVGAVGMRHLVQVFPRQFQNARHFFHRHHA